MSLLRQTARAEHARVWMGMGCIPTLCNLIEWEQRSSRSESFRNFLPARIDSHEAGFLSKSSPETGPYVPHHEEHNVFVAVRSKNVVLRHHVPTHRAAQGPDVVVVAQRQ